MENNKILEEKILKFNPNENGLRDHGIFGLPFSEEESRIVLLPIPWEGTVSYRGGTSLGPKAILEASQQIDLYDANFPDFWKKGIAFSENLLDIFGRSKKVSRKTQKYLKKYQEGKIDENLQNKINEEYEFLNDYVEKKTTSLLEKNKFIGIVGGEHGVVLGYLKALAKRHESFGILQIDAHADLRNAYEGLKYSHASIFRNALEIKNINKLIQIGIRDFSPEEGEFIDKNKNRVKVFSDFEIRKDILNGESFASICDKIISELPEKVYLSFDIDGLDPTLCPNTGTPVLGGFSFNEIVFLFEKINSSGKEIIGFDLCEVAPGKDDWDGNVAMRILYKMCLLSAKSFK